jgi:hypothetical protein
MASPFISKLVSTAAQLHLQHPFDVIYSFYMEPYGIAGHLASQITGAPHVTRMAGSDAGRLWPHPQFEMLYDHVLRCAERVIVSGPVAERAIQHGVRPEAIAADGGFLVPEELFSPVGPVLDVATLCAEVRADPDLSSLLWGTFRGDRPYFGIYGKLGERKGSFALLAALHRLQRAGIDVGLVALAHGSPQVNDTFRARARDLGLFNCILQIPFLPHWRVPEFLRGCLAVCCLEQDFPIEFHSPITPREVLLCGSCLVASTELIHKLPGYSRLPDRYGCVAIENVFDVEVLSDRLAAIGEDPKPVAAVGARARLFARELQQDVRFPEQLEHILHSAASRDSISPPASKSLNVTSEGSRFMLTRLAASELGENGGSLKCTDPVDLQGARRILANLEHSILDGRVNLRAWVPAIEAEIAVAAAESDSADLAMDRCDPLFRIRIRRWAIGDGDFAGLVPVCDPMARIVKFHYDVADFLGVRNAAQLPTSPTLRPSYIVAFVSSRGRLRSPLLVDDFTVKALELSDGSRTAAEIAKELACDCGGSGSMEDGLKRIEHLLISGLVWMHDLRNLTSPEECRGH